MEGVIFETVHGSHLYGWAHEGSDYDVFRVLSRYTTGARQTHVDGIDLVTVGINKFLERALSGSHQSVVLCCVHADNMSTIHIMNDRAIRSSFSVYELVHR